ncbi:hypothetical protein AB0E77_05635 [Streptomyces sp. NPDC032940]|uniref:hypothetical protein n=1 Tax=Streptomyces sp. NPDC032940 TaxID=3155366 RepID=UPI00340A785C
MYWRQARIRGFAATAALMAASALVLAGCGDGDAAATADERPTAVTATATPGDSPTPEAAPSTETPAPTPTPTPATLPDLSGGTIGPAVAAAEKAGVRYVVRLQGTGRTAASWGAGEKVCEQTGGPGDVTFTVPRDGRDCAGRLLHTPTPTPPAPEKTRDTGGSGGTGSGACELMSPAGNCYADGQFCANKHHGLSTHGRGGEYLTCSLDSGGRWRWSDGVAG